MTWRFVLATGTLALLATGARAQEMLSDPTFAAGKPAFALQGWEPMGLPEGLIKPITDQSGVVLSTAFTWTPGAAEAWEGGIAAPMTEVLPGRRYVFEVEARGQGRLSLGMQEYGWKYAAAVLSEAHREFALPPTNATLSFEYTPTADRIAFVRPFVAVRGWRCRAELRRASLKPRQSPADISVRAGHFIVAAGEPIEITVKSPSYPVKFLLYGPSGSSGPGGELGGADAFVDVFKTSVAVPGKPGGQVTYPLPMGPAATEGSYRLVAVDPASGASAAAHFAVGPKDRVREILDLVRKVNLPAGSRLVFVGDSLTANFPNRNYPALIERAFRWRFNGAVEVINAGIGGDNITMIAARLDRDVIQRNPTHVFLFEGANDCKRVYQPPTGQLGPWNVPVDKYETSFRDVLSRLAGKNIKVIVMTMAPGDQTILEDFLTQKKIFGDAGSVFCLPAEVSKAVEMQKKIAAEFKAEVIDTHAILTDNMARREKSGKQQFLHVDDGVHLSEYGNRDVALAVLHYLAGD